MYYQNYEDYMRAVLGYTVQKSNTYSNYNSSYLQFNDTNLAVRNIPNEESHTIKKISDNDFLEFYPEIYRIINPMVCKVCEKYKEPIDKELLQKMTDEIYNNLEETENTRVVNINATLSNPKNSTQNNSEKSQTKNAKLNQSSIQSVSQKNTSVAPTRKNTLLRDLIQILILKKLLEEGRFPLIQSRNLTSMETSKQPIKSKKYTDYYKF